jgi:light-regulated signal transduction histidine kinase (bacteriophytochrome)
LEKRYYDNLDSDAKDFISFAVDGAKRLQKMIESLLEYSRIETKGNPLKPISTENILMEALSNLEVAIKENGASITKGPLPVVLGDTSQLIHLFQNLISNSLKFRSEGKPRIDISARREGDEWLFMFRDNGIGIDPKYFDRIFIIFQRLHGYEYPGTGMGLSISKRIVERHGGRIWVEPQPDKGTSFFFTLPALKELNSGPKIKE